MGKKKNANCGILEARFKVSVPVRILLEFWSKSIR